jgi:hypothetical protein
MTLWAGQRHCQGKGIAKGTERRIFVSLLIKAKPLKEALIKI